MRHGSERRQWVSGRRWNRCRPLFSAPRCPAAASARPDPVAVEHGQPGEREAVESPAHRHGADVVGKLLGVGQQPGRGGRDDRGQLIVGSPVAGEAMTGCRSGPWPRSPASACRRARSWPRPPVCRGTRPPPRRLRTRLRCRRQDDDALGVQQPEVVSRDHADGLLVKFREPLGQQGDARATAIWAVSAITALPSSSLLVTVTSMPNNLLGRAGGHVGLQQIAAVAVLQLSQADEVSTGEKPPVRCDLGG